MQFLSLLVALLAVAAPTAHAYTPVVVGYYADWTAARLPATSIPYAKLTHVNYAFALSNDNGTFSLPTASLLKQVVSLAHKHNTKVLLSIGGWTGSRYFSPLMASAEKRAYMTRQLIDYVKTYNLDGIDFDYEFPGRVGMACNVVNPANDSANFLKFIKQYKAAKDKLKKKTEFTMAVRIAPFDKNGSPMADVSAFAAVTDRINIMAYDINGSWSGVAGPNAPLQDKKTPAASVVGSVKAWHNAKWPLRKMAMGVPFYGRAFTTKTQVASNKSVIGAAIETTNPKGDGDDALWAEPCPAAPQTYSGIWKWSKLRQGPLANPSGWRKGWDAVSQTPWLYHASTRQFITYDNAKSIALKSKYAVCTAKLSGVMIWDLSQDYQSELLNAINKAIHC